MIPSVAKPMKSQGDPYPPFPLKSREETKTGQDKDTTRQDKADKSSQGKASQDKTRQDETRRDEARQHTATQHNTKNLSLPPPASTAAPTDKDTAKENRSVFSLILIWF